MPTAQETELMGKLERLAAELQTARAAQSDAPAVPAAQPEYSAPSLPTGETIIVQDNIATMPRQSKPPVMNSPRADEAGLPKVALFDNQRQPVAPPVQTVGLVQQVPTQLTQQAPEISDLLFFTGQPKSGVSTLIKAIDAVEISATDAAELLAVNLFGTDAKNIPGIKQVIDQLIAYGEGVYTATKPATLERAVIVRTIQRLEGWETYGAPGYWATTLLASAQDVYQRTGKRVIITGVNSNSLFKSLQEAGYQHWHIMSSPNKRAQRGAAPAASNFQTALDNSVIKQISSNPGGKKLHVVWCDEGVNANSNRIWRAQDFILGAQIAPSVQEADTGEVPTIE